MKKIIYPLIVFLSVQTILCSQVNNDIENATPIEKPRVRLVALNTTDVTVTQSHLNRLRDIGEYIEDYYITQLTEKGHSLANTSMFARNTDGDVLIYMAQSTQPSSAISDLTSTAVNLAKAAYTDLTNLNSVWAVAHFKPGGGFVGGGSIDNGRMRFELKDISGSIDFSSKMAESDYHRGISLKAIHHELGHALTVLHNGPLRTNTMYNTLMGPINLAYENTVGISQTLDVQLTDYTAAIIAYHPVFRNSAYNSSELNGKTLEIKKIMGDNDLFTVDCTTGIAHIRGKVISNLPFHHVIIRLTYDNLESGGYWNSSFAVVPDSDGIFDLELTENDVNIGSASTNDFEYEVMVVFDNGLSRGVSQLEVSQEITTGKNQYVSTYSFDTNTDITQNITHSGNMISTDYSGAISYQWIDCNNNQAILGAHSQNFFPEITNGNFAVKVVTPDGCTHTSSCFNLEDLSVDKKNDSNVFEIYPNPSNEKVTIKSKNLKIQSIEVFNLTGQKVYKNNLRVANTEMTIKSPPKGVYFLRIRSETGLYFMKIISSK